MKITKTNLNGLLIIEPNIFTDHRGWFIETYNEESYKKYGININFKQDNHSYSKQRGVLRGLHFQNEPYAQTKLVRCTRGKIWDVAVDLRKSSPTYLKWFGIELTSENQKSLLIPQGFAHGFITLDKNTEVQYKVDNFYEPNSDRSIRYNDPNINIQWPIINVIISEKDLKAPYLRDSDVNFK